MTASTDFSFERAAADYDRLRAYPSLIARQIGQRLIEPLGRKPRLLELGVGTGRIAMPLSEAGAHVVGIDVSPAMLDGWRRKTQTAPQATQGDIGSLPFASQRFDAVIAVHVLHLVRDPEPVLHEIRRVLRPQRPLLLGSDWRDPAAIDQRVRQQWRRIVAELAPTLRPPQAGREADLLALLAAQGASVTAETVVIEWSDHVSAAIEIDRIATGQHSESWALSSELLQQSVERLNRWLFAEQIDPNLGELAQREFRLITAHWPTEQV